jgi:hypothetical protein
MVAHAYYPSCSRGGYQEQKVRETPISTTKLVVVVFTYIPSYSRHFWSEAGPSQKCKTLSKQ